jgi:hypothetical protein
MVVRLIRQWRQHTRSERESEADERTCAVRFDCNALKKEEAS